MPSHRFLVVGVAAYLGFFGCAHAPGVDTRAEADAIRELGRRWEAAVTARDIETALNFYAPQALEMQPNAPVAVGREAIWKWYKSWLTPGVSNTWSTEVVEVAASGDLA